jgi:bacteriorhodopsin
VIGASVVHPWKWAWWTVGMFFFGIIIYKFVCFYSKVKEANADLADNFRTLLAITVISWCVYPIVWVLGSEGLAAITIDMEVRLFSAWP